VTKKLSSMITLHNIQILCQKTSSITHILARKSAIIILNCNASQNHKNCVCVQEVESIVSLVFVPWVLFRARLGLWQAL